jgi:hypothetical protein
VIEKSSQSALLNELRRTISAYERQQAYDKEVYENNLSSIQSILSSVRSNYDTVCEDLRTTTISFFEE